MPQKAGRQLLAINIALLAFTSASSLANLLVPLVGFQLQGSIAVAGAVISIGALTPLLFTFHIGSLVGSFGSRTVMIGAAVLLCLAPLPLLLSISIPALAVTAVLINMAHTLFAVAAQQAVANLGAGTGSERRFGWYSSFLAGGHMLGPFLGGFAIAAVGLEPSFALVPLIGTATVILCTRLAPAAKTSSPATPLPRTPIIQRLNSFLKLPGLRISLVVTAGVVAAQAVRQTFLPIHMETHNLDARLIGIVLGARAFTSMVIRPALPLFSKVIGTRSRVFFAMMIVMAAGLAMTAFAVTLVPLLMAAVLVGISSGVTQPLTMVAITDHVSKERIGTALSLRLSINRVAQASAPLLFGIIGDTLGMEAAFIGAAALLLLALLPVARTAKTFEAAEQKLS